MKIAVYSKSTFKNATIVNDIIDYIKSEGFDVVNVDTVDESIIADKLLVFGGDGTMLYAVKNSAIPVFGINVGNVGFLTGLEANGNMELLPMILSGAKNVQDRFMLSASINNKSFNALNEVVLKTADTRPIKIALYVDDFLADTYHADGVIVATPTGSTAYSLSAGGAVLSPEVDAVEIIPICAHSLHSRPIIVSNKSNVRLVLTQGNGDMIIDGDKLVSLEEKGEINIVKSSKYAKFVTFAGDDYYKKLYTKLNKWGTNSL